MGGGVNPLEWIIPPVALTHTLVDQAAKAAGTSIPGTPGSPDAKAAGAAKDAENRANMERQAAQERITNEPRAQTPFDETDSRRRAGMAAEQLGGGRRRKASQTLTDPGNLLSGSLAGSYGP